MGPSIAFNAVRALFQIGGQGKQLAPRLDDHDRWDKWRAALPESIVEAIAAGTLAPVGGSDDTAAPVPTDGDDDGADSGGPVILTPQDPVAVPIR